MRQLFSRIRWSSLLLAVVLVLGAGASPASAHEGEVKIVVGPCPADGGKVTVTVSGHIHSFPQGKHIINVNFRENDGPWQTKQVEVTGPKDDVDAVDFYANPGSKVTAFLSWKADGGGQSPKKYAYVPKCPKPSATASLQCPPEGTGGVDVVLANDGNAAAPFDVNGTAYTVEAGAPPYKVPALAVPEDGDLRVVVKSGEKVLIDQTFHRDCEAPPPPPVATPTPTPTPPASPPEVTPPAPEPPVYKTCKTRRFEVVLRKTIHNFDPPGNIRPANDARAFSAKSKPGKCRYPKVRPSLRIVNWPAAAPWDPNGLLTICARQVRFKKLLKFTKLKFYVDGELQEVVRDGNCWRVLSRDFARRGTGIAGDKRVRIVAQGKVKPLKRRVRVS